MLLDNKTKTEDSEYCKVFDYLRDYIENGKVDLVTGFFSINALALLNDEINNPEKYRMILGNLLQDDNQHDKIIDLLNGDSGIKNTLALSQAAQKAVAFLQQNKVEIKNIQKNFCHAKTYIYKDSDPRKNFFIVGSSNLTDAGLGIKDSSNIELNTATTGNEADYKEIQNWFLNQWTAVALDKITLPDKSNIEVKQYIIDLISNLFKEYSPLDLYYKVLYELFKEDLLLLTGDVEFKKEIAHLEETDIYNILYPYQQKGVISLIKMLQRYNGAILADAVGLGKTWTALAVMKYFEMKGYKVVLFCPKKLRQNWEQYQDGANSKFKNDEITYLVRNHTDLQDERLDNYADHKLGYLQRRQKLLVVIDESHNLRNDKSNRFKYLVDKILLPDHPKRDVKVLQLSATPINNKLLDIRNQFKLMVKGGDHGFDKTDLEIASLESIFRTAQADFNSWAILDDRKISDFIAKLPQKFFSLTDALIVARTRKLIESEFGEMNFPKKAIPGNEFISTVNIGNLKSFADILDALRINLTAYRPSDYIKKAKPVSVLDDPKQREKFLVKMMYILLVKRLESSWYSFKSTVETILNHHESALKKVNEYLETRIKTTIAFELNTEDAEDIGDAAAQMDDEEELPEFFLGKKHPINLDDITDIEKFKTHIVKDIKKLTSLKANLDQYVVDLENKKTDDPKIERLISHIEEKQNNTDNKKVLIFTVYKDTAKYIFDELKSRGHTNLAFVSGAHSETNDGYTGKKFEPILERFAPFTKLYNEKDWTELYEVHLGREYIVDDKWKVSYEEWVKTITAHDPATAKKINKPIDILIATDCLSEGQNLQDCDLVINYDIHWNPVRLIQRMGRIDRLGSPNATVKGINFWPAKDFGDYLNLKSRVENRMALMSVVGTEMQDQLTPEFEKLIEDNPLLPKHAEKMLAQMKDTWDDLDTGNETLGLNDLSLEQFRQELFEFFKKNEEFFKKIPNGVFTGFKYKPEKKYKDLPPGIVAVLGYPRKPDEQMDHTYQELHLLFEPMLSGTNMENRVVLKNNHDILGFLRANKNEARYVPKAIENGEAGILETLSTAINQWITAQVPHVAMQQLNDLFKGTIAPQKLHSDKKVEEKYQSENFDLINWFIISKK